MTREKKFGLLTIMITIGLCVIIGELVLRRVLPASRMNRTTGYAYIYGWAMPPNSIVEWQVDGKQLHESINSDGFRDVEHDIASTKGRILIIGDSYTAGIGVSLDQLYTRQLQAMLPANVEVISMGIGGIGTDQELLMLEHQGLAYRPEIVILQFYTGNDPLNNLYGHLFGNPSVPKPYFRLEGENLFQVPFHPSVSWKAHLFDFRLIEKLNTLRHVIMGDQKVMAANSKQESKDVFAAIETLDLFDIEKDYSPYSLYVEKYSRKIEYAWDLTEALIFEMDKICHRAGSDFLVFPALWQIDLADESMSKSGKHGNYVLYPERAFEELRQRIEKHSIKMVQSRSAFKRAVAENGIENYLIPGDNHWNARGHRLAAETIYQYLTNSDFYLHDQEMMKNGKNSHHRRRR
jgi:hypothetical protein